jgi:probable F420-dependent oxidoreductase
MRFGVCIPTYDRYGDPVVLQHLIREAERLGFDSVWFGDHIVVPGYATAMTDPHWYEAITTAAMGIGMTSRLRFGTDVLVTPNRNPLLLAKMAATASELSGGRLILGMGIGYLQGEFEALGSPDYKRRGAVTDEYLAIMRRLFEKRRPAAFKGEWFDFEDVHFGPIPASPPPILVGGNHPKGLERAALLGDGWHPLFCDPAAYAAGRDAILAIRDRERVVRPFTFSYSCPRTRLLMPGEAPPVESYGIGERPHEYAYIPSIGRTADGRQHFIGTADQMIEDIAAYRAAGVEQMVLRFALAWDPDITPDRIAEQWAMFTEQVAPAF